MNTLFGVLQWQIDAFFFSFLLNNKVFDTFNFIYMCMEHTDNQESSILHRDILLFICFKLFVLALLKVTRFRHLTGVLGNFCGKKFVIYKNFNVT